MLEELYRHSFMHLTERKPGLIPGNKVPTQMVFFHQVHSVVAPLLDTIKASGKNKNLWPDVVLHLYKFWKPYQESTPDFHRTLFLGIHIGFSQVTWYRFRKTWYFIMDHHTKTWVKFFYLLSYFLFPYLIHPFLYPLSFYYSFIVLLWTHQANWPQLI